MKINGNEHISYHPSSPPTHSSLHVRFSVMQSNGNRFCGDVVLEGVNMAYRDTDNTLDHVYEKQIFFDFFHEDFEKI